jgi:hypothetical protein
MVLSPINVIDDLIPDQLDEIETRQRHGHGALCLFILLHHGPGCFFVDAEGLTRWKDHSETVFTMAHTLRDALNWVGLSVEAPIAAGC